MKKILFAFVCLFTHTSGLFAQNDAWHIVADNIDPANYYGITVANGMIGLVSSPEPMRVKDVVLNGAYDNYGRGRVSNILKGFNFVNMNLDVDGRRIGRKDISAYKQTLDMRGAQLTTTFTQRHAPGDGPAPPALLRPEHGGNHRQKRCHHYARFGD